MRPAISIGHRNAAGFVHGDGVAGSNDRNSMLVALDLGLHPLGTLVDL